MKTPIIIISIFLLFINTTNAQEPVCSNIDNHFEKYECRVNTYCNDYEIENIIFQIENFKTADEYQKMTPKNVFLVSNHTEKPIQKAVGTYKDNMNSIYRCGIINIQKNSLNLIKDKLNLSGILKAKIDPKITNLLNRLNIVSQNSKCLGGEDRVFNKLDILKQVTYQTCSFNYYMDYLQNDYYGDIRNVLGMDEDIDNNQSFNTSTVVGMQANIKNSIIKEVDQAYKTFPIAFTAYSEYENNFGIHFLLEITKEVYIVFREKLHKTLSPLNQVVYKISNAMSK